MSVGATTEERIAPSRSARRTTPAAALAALGIVYGDLGTSPLYTLQTVVQTIGGRFTAEAAIGVLSLIFWALIVTISVKYCLFVMRADNHGEGGILALMPLAGATGFDQGRALVVMGLFGAALIYGDGIITPAISVLSALEGVNVATEVLEPFVMPAAVAVLLCLFAAQRRGTARIGKVFGPLMLLWFCVIAALGIGGILRHPNVLAAVDPRHAIAFLAHGGWSGFTVLGGIFLAITGGEALYADMGHIGKNPIRTTWYGLVLPALLLNYAGQTALLIEDPTRGGNPFFTLAPGWAIFPLVLLATLATIIASQAIITGSFSLTRQAMQLGWFPGLHIRQTSDEEYGQIYVPFVNWTMMLFTIALAVGFGRSDRLAGAYGTAVSTTMLLTTALLYKVMRNRWGWSAPSALLTSGLFLVVDLSFFAANLMKIVEGGWIPLTFGAIVFIVMTTWHSGIEAMARKLATMTEPPERFLQRLATDRIPRVPGTAVFLTRLAEPIPPLMILHVSQFGVLPQTAIALTVRFADIPRVGLSNRLQLVPVFEGFWHLTAHYGFVEIPDLQATLRAAKDRGCPVDLSTAVYFGAHDQIIRAKMGGRLLRWRVPLFAFLFRNAVRTVDLFNLPTSNFLEIGRQIEI
jgi:KUP system potassium uptake protein